ncbi:MAG: EamA family transporter RarD [Pseudomonadota bacterium]
MNNENRANLGVFYAIAAYGMWGVAPIYFKQLTQIPAQDILIHRIVWAAVLLLGMIFLLKQRPMVQLALKTKQTVVTLIVAGALLALNWFIFIWAVNHDYLLETSLGYFISPLVNVAFGALFLGERFRRLQILAVAIAIIGVSYSLITYGKLPWVALGLAITFSVYGLLRKKATVDALPGLFIETVLLLPFVMLYLLFISNTVGDMGQLNTATNLLLLAAGAVSVAPLLCFTAAARRLRLSTLGFFQYIGPSIMFVLATFIYDEPLSHDRFITFIFVWTALIIFSLDSFLSYKTQRNRIP